MPSAISRRRDASAISIACASSPIAARDPVAWCLSEVVTADPAIVSDLRTASATPLGD
jgi:hypothetical protein